MSERKFYEGGSTIYSNNDGVPVASTSVTVVTTASDGSAAVVETDSTKIVSDDTSTLYAVDGNTYTQEYHVTSGVPPMIPRI